MEGGGLACGRGKGGGWRFGEGGREGLGEVAVHRWMEGNGEGRMKVGGM